MEHNLLNTALDSDLLSEAERLFCDVAGHFTNAEYVSFKTALELHFAFLSDEISIRAENEYTRHFTDGIFKKMSSGRLSFKPIPINASIGTFPQPLILISDESELDRHTEQIVKKRTENGFTTYPIIIFSDEFFKPVFGEKVDYIAIIDAFERATDCTVVAFRKSDLTEYPKLVQKYVFYLACLVRTEALIDVTDKICCEMYDQVTEYLKISKKGGLSNLDRLKRIQQGKAVLNYADNLSRCLSDLQKQREETCLNINDMRSTYDRHIDELINQHIRKRSVTSSTADTSQFAINIDLKYGQLNKYVIDFAEYAEEETKYLLEDYVKVIKDTAKFTRESLESRTAKLSLIGTFSSGKTTLINSFLGSGKKRVLKTSAKHNTAVLMEINYTGSNESEFCEFIYKKRFKWSLLRNASKDDIYTNEELYPIKILNIEDLGNEYKIYYQVEAKERWRTSINIRRTNYTDLAIRPNITLQRGQAFNVRRDRPLEREKCIPASRPEIQLIIDCIRQGKLRSAKISYNGDTITNNARIEAFLKELYKISADIPDKAISLCDASELLKHLRSTDQRALLDVTIDGELNYSSYSESLDEQKWAEMFGSLDGTSKVLPFAETPGCYMLLEEMRLSLHSDFLKYCDITDTPGFGSVTEVHDKTTESYIRDKPGTLAVMIKVNATTNDAKYIDLINKIDNLYNSYRKKEKKTIIFILNCFTNTVKEENLKRTVDQLRKELIKKGFNRDNIFVCDIKRSISHNERPRSMMGYPSYQALYEHCMDIIESDLDNRYEQIHSEWTTMINNVIDEADRKIFENEKRLSNLVKSRGDLREKINIIKNLSVDNTELTGIISETINIFDDQLHEILDAYQNTKKGLVKNIRLNTINGKLENTQKSLNSWREENTENIQELFKGLIKKISYYANSDIGVPKIDDPDEPIIVLTYEALRSLLNAADDNTPRLIKKKSTMEKYSGEITEMIEKDRDDSVKRIEEYWSDCCSSFLNYQSAVIKILENELASLENEQTIRERNRELEKVKKKFGALKIRFGKINF